MVLLLLVSITSCRKKEVIDIPTGPAETTVIIYMAAENSLSAYATSQRRDADLNELVRAAKSIPLDCRVVVYVDDTDMPRTYSISAHQGLTTLQVMPEHDSADPNNFERTISLLVADFPARQYGLVLWSHGSGWIPQHHTSPSNVATGAPGKPQHTFGIDNNLNLGTNEKGADKGTEMNIDDMRTALEHIGIHWRYILFDACFMQCVEVDYELRNLTDYIIASPAEIPGEGAPYDVIMPQLTHPTEQNITAITDGYYNNYSTNGGCVISVVKTNELDSLLSLTRQLMPDFYTRGYDLDCDLVQPYCAYIYHSSWKPEYYDMASVMHHALTDYDYLLWTQQLQRTVIAQQHTGSWPSIYYNYGFRPYFFDREHLAIMSIFVPNRKYDLSTTYNQDIRQTSWYKAYNQNITTD